MKLRIVCLILLMTAYAIADDLSDAKSSAQTLGTEINSAYSDSSSAKQKLYNPLVSGTNMETLQRSWKCADNNSSYETQTECDSKCSQTCSINTFNSQLQCTSSTQAVSITPYSFSAGGEVSLKIQYDTDLDGTVDTSFTTSNISGFCTNGYVSCTPGTFQNCKYYEFGIKHKCGSTGTVYNTYRECSAACPGTCSAADNKTLAFQRSVAEMRYTGGCFCSNASCGSSFNAVFHNALAYYGGGITGHMMSELGLALTDTQIDVSTLSVKYFGASATSCQNISDDKVSTLKSYYQSGSIDYDSELTNQMSDSESYYSLTTSVATTPTSTKSCSISNTASIRSDGTLKYWCVPSGIHSYLYIRNSDDQVISDYECIDSDGDGRGDTINFRGSCVVGGRDNCRNSNGWQSVRLANATSEWKNSGAYVQTNWNSNNIDFYINYKITCSDTICTLSYWQNATNWSVIPVQSIFLSTIQNENVEIVRTDSCDAYSKDSACKLNSEQINDKYDTVTNYLATNISPESSCKQFDGSSSKFIICDYGYRFDVTSSAQYTMPDSQTYANNTPYTVSSKNDGLEWFSVKRTYVCKDSSEAYDFNDAKAQADLVGTSLNKDTGDFSYNSDSGITSENAKIDTDSVNACTYTCVVQTGDQDTTIFPDQTTRQDTNDIIKEQRPCGIDFSTGSRSCPYDSSSEKLLADCACTNSFNDVISIFSSVNDAVKDMICSSSSPE